MSSNAASRRQEKLLEIEKPILQKHKVIDLNSSMIGKNQDQGKTNAYGQPDRRNSDMPNQNNLGFAQIKNEMFGRTLKRSRSVLPASAEKLIEGGRTLSPKIVFDLKNYKTFLHKTRVKNESQIVGVSKIVRRFANLSRGTAMKEALLNSQV